MSEPKDPEKVPSPELRKAVSRRGFLTSELKTASVEAVKQLPAFGGILGGLLKESPAQRDERLVDHLWVLLMGRKPRPEECKASLDLVKNAGTPDEKADALVDILWALMQTRDFEELARPDLTLVRGLYLIAQDREPTEGERDAALDVIREAVETARRTCAEAEESDEASRINPEDAALAARTGAMEGLFTGLLRAPESVLRKSYVQPGPRSIFRRPG